MCCRFFFFFNDTATTEIYTLSLHDALPILEIEVTESVFLGHSANDIVQALETLRSEGIRVALDDFGTGYASFLHLRDRKSTRLNSSHANISYAVFCLKKKKTYRHHIISYSE